MNNAHFEVKYDDKLHKQTWERIGYKALIDLWPHLKLAVDMLEKPGYRYEDHYGVVKITRLRME